MCYTQYNLIKRANRPLYFFAIANNYDPALLIILNAYSLSSVTFEIAVGENIMYDIELFEGKNELFFQGSGTITLIHRGGTL